MGKTKKEKKEEVVEYSLEKRRTMVIEQLEKAMKEREKITTLIIKCQGALELIDSLDEEVNLAEMDENND